MRTLTSSVRFTLATAMLVPCLALAWATGVPDALIPLGYALFAGLLTALLVDALTPLKIARSTVNPAPAGSGERT